MILGAATLSGCYIDIDDISGDGYGDLTVSYTFDGVQCDQADVARVRVSLSGENTGDSYTDTLGCGRFRDGVTVFDLLSDRYSVRVEGLDVDGYVLYSMERTLTTRVYSDESNFIQVNLVGASGDLLLNWDFPGNEQCDLVDTVHVRLWDPSGVLYDDAGYLCSFGGVEYTRLAPGRWTVQMRGLDIDDRVVFRLNERAVDVVERAYNEYTLTLND